MDGLFLMSPDASRTLRKFPLSHIARWATPPSAGGAALVLYTRTPVDVEEVTLRTDSPRSPKSPHGKTPRRRYKDEDFDLAGMAFRRTVFGPGERPDPSAPPAEDEFDEAFEDALSPPRREKIYGDDVIEQRAA